MVNKSSVAIVVNKAGEFLLQKKTLDYKWFSGGWSLFGGGIKDGETPLEAIKRELKEELGICFEKIKFFKKNSFEIGNNSFENEVFLVNFNGRISEIILNEGAGFAFFSKEELNSLNIFPGIRKILTEYIQNCH